MALVNEPASRETFRQKLADLLGHQDRAAEGDDPWLAIAQTQATRGRSAPSTDAERTVDGGSSTRLPAGTELPAELSSGEFIPLAPTTIKESGLSESEIESLILKYLLNRGSAAGRDVAEQLKLPFRLIEVLLRRLKEEMLLVYKGSATLGDYIYEPTELGYDRARRYSQRCTYFGTAPVSLSDYVASVAAQSVMKQQPRMSDLRKAFGDLVMGEQVLNQIGQAVNAGMGLFLYGAPGNGKTSIAERITKAFGEDIWMPRAISVFGEIVRLFDPSSHITLPQAAINDPYDQPWIDRRWVRIRRPTIVVGGELTMDSLEISTNTATGISEAPLQMKANCGTLVIDDFGRQRVSATELLNRWIVPLEKRHDFLCLANNRKIQVPFDQLVIFSTNLEPRHLVDEAFLRRIPYKIDVADPTEEQFRSLFREVCRSEAIEYREESMEYLLDKTYRQPARAMRFCHPRDLLRQVKVFCNFNERPLAVSCEAIDAAVKNYFAIM